MRKQTPDILSGLMGQSETGPAKQHAGIPEDPNAGMLDQKPAKATYYLSPDVIDSLEESWFQLRRVVNGSRGKISKSKIVEIALDMAIEDFEKNGVPALLQYECAKLLIFASGLPRSIIPNKIVANPNPATIITADREIDFAFIWAPQPTLSVGKHIFSCFAKRQV